MKEDLLEKEIKKFAMILQRLAGMIVKGNFDETLKTIALQYDEQLIDSFLEGEKVDPSDRFALKKLSFQIDLMYYQIVAQYRCGLTDEAFIQKFLAAAQKFQTMNGATFDFALKMKMDEIKRL